MVNEIINETPQSIPIFTDGSKTAEGTGAAFIAGTISHLLPLPKLATIYTAELFAIEKALQTVKHSNNHIIICTDSLSSLQSLKKLYTTNHLVNSIRTSIFTMKNNDVDVQFLWVPSHSGIVGNEKADTAAKSAATRNENFNHLYILEDIICFAKRTLNNHWNTDWFRVTNNKLREIKGSVSPWTTSIRDKRREEVILTRLRIGHTRLTHEYLMTRSSPPICRTCNTQLTVKHILTDCTQYADKRRLFELSSDISDILSNCNSEIRKLLDFLQDTGLHAAI